MKILLEGGRLVQISEIVVQAACQGLAKSCSMGRKQGRWAFVKHGSKT